MNYKVTTTVPEIERTCEAIQDLLMKSVIGAESNLHQVRNLVRGQKAAIIAEIGTENATALQTVYTKLKEAVEAGKGVTVADLPD